MPEKPRKSMDGPDVAERRMPEAMAEEAMKYADAMRVVTGPRPDGVLA